jgi:hypothetical protein
LSFVAGLKWSESENAVANENVSDVKNEGSDPPCKTCLGHGVVLKHARRFPTGEKGFVKPDGPVFGVPGHQNEP